jgi:hypothetical protein
LLAQVGIRAERALGKVAIQTDTVGGVLIGASVEVTYLVKAPASAVVRVRTGDGPITVTGRFARLVVSTADGEIARNGLAGGVEARATNRNITLDLPEAGGQLIDARTTNGSIQLALPADTDANISATLVNGDISIAGVPFEPPLGEQTRRRVRGGLNAGGAPIELATAVGDTQVRERR